MQSLRRGARILTSRALTNSCDALQGTQHLLTQAGREKLLEMYKQDLASGGEALMTSLDTSFDHLEKAGFFSDYSRDNDLSYYVVGKGTGAGGYELQGKGKTFLIPRGAGVSTGEKRDFAQMLCSLACQTAVRARAETDTVHLLGATIQFSGKEDGTNLADGSLHLGNRMEAQITAAAAAQPDFLVIAGCDTPADVSIVASVLAKHTLREERQRVVDLRGMETLAPEPSTCGFDVPALLLLRRAANGDLREMATAAAESDHIGGVAIVDAQLDEPELDAIFGLLRSHGRPQLLAGREERSVHPDAGLAVLRCHTG